MTGNDLYEDAMREDREDVASVVVSDRLARCSCGQTVPSSIARTERAFFQDRGPSSPFAKISCGVCRYHEVAHGEPNVVTKRPGIVDHAFEPAPLEFDSYYCGCRGWD